MPSSTYCAQYKANLRWSAIRWVRKHTTALECGLNTISLNGIAYPAGGLGAGDPKRSGRFGATCRR
jgi:hypothetical protein